MKVVFLDRDGTLIVEPPDERLVSEKDIQLFPDTIAALKRLADSGYVCVMISNQAGIGEGLIDLDEFYRLNNYVLDAIAPSGMKFVKVAVCPHTAADNCDCRKPKPKLILDAAQEYNLDLSQTYTVGDRLSDIEAGINAGTKTILVKTGIEPVEAPQATYTAKNLLEVAKYIIGHESATI